MNNPTCLQCDCVAGCQANPALCPNVALPSEPVVWRKANSDGFYRYYEADEDQPASCEPLYLHPIAQPEQAVNQTDIDHIFETIYDHGNGKYQGAVSKAQRDKAIAICEALGQSIAQPEKTNPAPGYCKSCKEYTIEEPMVAQPEQNAAANKTLSTLIYRIKNLNDNRLLQWELTDTFTEYQAAVAQPKAQP